MASPEEIENEIATLPRGAVKDSIKIFTAWMRANREALQAQIAGLAVRFEEIDRENKRRLDEIHRETRKTNGRVTDLEKSAGIEAALTEGREEWESGHEAQKREAAEARDRQREKSRDRLMSVGLVLLGMFGGVVVPAFLKHLGVS